jgi:hypothetical protein
MNVLYNVSVTVRVHNILTMPNIQQLTIDDTRVAYNSA